MKKVRDPTDRRNLSIVFSGVSLDLTIQLNEVKFIVKQIFFGKTECPDPEGEFRQNNRKKNLFPNKFVRNLNCPDIWRLDI